MHTHPSPPVFARSCFRRASGHPSNSYQLLDRPSRDWRDSPLATQFLVTYWAWSNTHPDVPAVHPRLGPGRPALFHSHTQCPEPTRLTFGGVRVQVVLFEAYTPVFVDVEVRLVKFLPLLNHWRCMVASTTASHGSGNVTAPCTCCLCQSTCLSTCPKPSSNTRISCNTGNL